jgi:hypothetical protein
VHTSWNTAAEAAVKEIFAAEVRPCSIEALRGHLDGLIEKYLPTGGDVATGGSRRMRESWVELGRMARSLGSNIDFLNFSDAFRGDYQHVLDIVVRKQRDYGHENIARFGRMGLLVRVHDKIARLENLLDTGSSPNHESIEDNIVDVIGYSIVGAMWEEGTFLLALEQPTVAESEPASSLNDGMLGFLRLA